MIPTPPDVEQLLSKKPTHQVSMRSSLCKYFIMTNFTSSLSLNYENYCIIYLKDQLPIPKFKHSESLFSLCLKFGIGSWSLKLQVFTTWNVVLGGDPQVTGFHYTWNLVFGGDPSGYRFSLYLKLGIGRRSSGYRFSLYLKLGIGRRSFRLQVFTIPETWYWEEILQVTGFHYTWNLVLGGDPSGYRFSLYLKLGIGRRSFRLQVFTIPETW